MTEKRPKNGHPQRPNLQCIAAFTRSGPANEHDRAEDHQYYRRDAPPTCQKIGTADHYSCDEGQFLIVAREQGSVKVDHFRHHEVFHYPDGEDTKNDYCDRIHHRRFDT